MHRGGRHARATIAGSFAGSIVAAALGTSSIAAADPTQLGLYVGPRVYSDDSRLGYIEEAPAHPTLENGIQIGARVARPFFPWLVPELELTFAPTSTTAVGGAAAADVLWLAPRLHVRFELLPGRRVQPFLVVGAGAPVVLSSARMTLNSGITGEGYAGAGVRLDAKRFAIRFDARVSAIPGIERYFTPELDITLGVELALGTPSVRGKERPPPPLADRDGDGIADGGDKCPDREEDHDGFDDLDGCPDIDNDLDRVLDIADRCATVPETYNGFEDDDGCPDTVPQEVDALRGTVEGLIYADGETVVRESAQGSIQKIAQTMTTYPSIKVLLIGHTDDREAKAFAIPDEGGEPPDVGAVAADLARARAEAVRQALIAAGIGEARVDIQGVGFDDPVADNESAKGRLANRRVEIKLYVPLR